MKLFTIDFNDKEPLYIQLYNKIKKDILNNTIKPNEKLPSKRELHNHLGISLNTIIEAYNLLLDEGFISSIPKKGYYAIDYNITLSKKFNNYNIIDKQTKYKYDFTTKGIDTSIFPYYTWNKISKNIIYNQEFINKSDNKGSMELRKTLSKYLYETKGINVNPNNIIIGSGIEYLLTLLINILPCNTYGIENPGYDKINKILLNNKKQVNYIPLDNDGIDVNKLNNSECIYITPANQFPTGIKMTLQRKLDLIKWSLNKYIIEDDFDSEFKYLSNTSTCLYRLSPNNTILLSTYSRTITPSIRLSFMILPDDILKLYNEKYSFYSSTVSTLDQLILNDFIKSGAYSRHLNKTKTIYRDKRKKIISLLEKYDFIKIDYDKSYLSLIIEIPPFNKELFKLKCINSSIDISLLDDYYFTKENTNKIIIGYTSIDINILEEGINLIINIIKETIIK